MAKHKCAIETEGYCVFCDECVLNKPKKPEKKDNDKEEADGETLHLRQSDTGEPI